MHAQHRGRRLILPSFAILALAAITCRSTAYFNLDHSGTIALQAGASPDAAPWTLSGLNDINLSAHPLMAAQGLHTTDVTQAVIQKVTLAIEPPPTGADLSFLSRVDVVLNADGMQPLTVATGTTFPIDVPLVALTVSEAQVTGYLKGKHPSFTVVPTYAAAVPQNLTVGLRLITQTRVGEPGGSCQN